MTHDKRHATNNTLNQLNSLYTPNQLNSLALPNTLNQLNTLNQPAA